MMPIPGEKMYRVFDGHLEEVVFVEESLADAHCTITTYVVRKNAKKIRVSKGMYFSTPLDAWIDYRDVLTNITYPAVYNELVKMRRNFKDTKEEIEKVQKAIKFYSQSNYFEIYPPRQPSLCRRP